MIANRFANRVRLHDEVALPLVIDTFRRYGFHVDRYGVETGSPITWQMLAAQRDLLALMLRFRPDIVGIRPKRTTVLCEVKSDSGAKGCFALEFDSWLSALQWNKTTGRVMYAFVDILEQVAYGCWVADVTPDYVRVPKRFDFQEQMTRLREQFPWVVIQPVEHRNGSGTPYFLIPKDSERLLFLDDFILNELY